MRFTSYRSVALAFIALFGLIATALMAQPFSTPGAQTPVQKIQTASPDTPAFHYGYYEYLPTDYNHTSAQKFGLMIFLHGSGERGTGKLPSLRKVIWGSNENVDNSPQWPPAFISRGAKSYPLIVLSPQCSNANGDGDCGWWEGDRLRRFVSAAILNYNVDINRIYVTGLSMGGAGTVLVSRAFNPVGTTTVNTIAAILSICQAEGGLEALNAPLRNMPMWVAHAYDDGVVNWGESRFFLDGVTEETASITSGFTYPISPASNPPTHQTALYNIANTASSGVAAKSHTWINADTSTSLDHNIRQRFTVYKDGGHGIWSKAYNDSNMMGWLFKQRLNQEPQNCNLDVNAGGAFDVKDARATVAWILGFRGTALETIAGFSGTNAAAIDSFLQTQLTAGALDLDGDAQVHASTDGLMLLRVALGLTGNAVTTSAVNPNGTRVTWDAIKNQHLISQCKLTL
jgi:poly(3-hydroxybutyrate) depolymerase